MTRFAKALLFWSQREESPRGEEPRAAGARAQRGIRPAVEPASGRVAGRWRSQIPNKRKRRFYRIYRDRATGAWFADGIYD